MLLRLNPRFQIWIVFFLLGQLRNSASLRTVEEMDSQAALGVAERVAEGKLSITAASEFAENLTFDGANKAMVCHGWVFKRHCNRTIYGTFLKK